MLDSDTASVMIDAASTADADVAAPIRLANLAWVVLALAAMAAVTARDDLWAVDFIHVLADLLWTGIDLFMGFVIGPVLRRLSLPARRAIVCRLMPKMLFLMPTLSIVTGTTAMSSPSAWGFWALPIRPSAGSWPLSSSSWCSPCGASESCCPPIFVCISKSASRRRTPPISTG